MYEDQANGENRQREETPAEQKPPYLLENQDIPSVDWAVVADFKNIWLDLGGTEDALEVILKHTRVVTPELEEQHHDAVVRKVHELLEENPRAQVTLIATGGRSGKDIAQWFAVSQDKAVQELRNNPNLDCESLELGAEYGAQYVGYAPKKLLEDAAEQIVCIIDDWSLSGEKMSSRIRQLEEKINNQRKNNGMVPLKYWVLVGGISKYAQQRISKIVDDKSRINIQATYLVPSVVDELDTSELESVNTSLKKVSGESWVEIEPGKYLVLNWKRGAPDNFPSNFTALSGIIDKDGHRHVLFKFLP